MTSRRWEVGLLILIGAACLWHPYYYGVGDHTYKVPFLKAAYDPTLFAADVTIQLRGLYVSLFALVMRPLVAVFGFADGDWVAYLLTRAGFLAGVYFLARELTGNKAAALLATAILWFPRPVMGGISTFDVILEERGVAFVIVLAALIAWLKHRPWLAGLLTGAAGCIHFVTVANLGIFLACLMLLELRDDGAVRRWGSYLAGVVAGLLPVIYVSQTRAQRTDLLAMMDPEWLKIIAARSTHHHDPSAAWPSFVAHLTLGVAVLLAVSAVRAQPAPATAAPDRLHRWLVAGLASMPVGFGIGWLVMGPWPWHFGVMLNTLRVDHLFTVLSYIGAASVLVMVSFTRPVLLIIGMAFALCRVRFQVVVMAATALWAFITHRRASVDGLGQLRHGVLGLVLVSCLVSFPFVAFDMAQFRPIDPDNRQLQDWMKDHLPEEALVLTPPLANEDFRVFSDRSNFGSWKDLTYAELDRAFGFTMLERLRLAYGITLDSGLEQAPAHYAGLTADQLAALTARFRVTHVVRMRADPLPWPLLHQNDRFLLYEVPQGR